MKCFHVALSMVMAVGLVGCGGDSTGPTTVSYVGTYRLAAVNDGALPARYLKDAPGLTIISGTTTLRADSSFTETTNYSTPVPGSEETGFVTLIDNGTYSVAGSQLTFTITDKSSWRFGLMAPYRGAVYGDKLSLTWDGNSYIYRRTL